MSPSPFTTLAGSFTQFLEWMNKVQMKSRQNSGRACDAGLLECVLTPHQPPFLHLGSHTPQHTPHTAYYRMIGLPRRLRVMRHRATLASPPTVCSARVTDPHKSTPN